MDPAQDRALRCCMRELCENMDLTEVLVRLIAAGILPPRTVQEIKAERTPYEQNQKLVLLLLEKTSNAFDIFLSALRDCGQDYLRTRICEAVQRPFLEEASTERKEVSQLLKNYYIEQFRRFRPFSENIFNFDMESTFVQLELSAGDSTTEKHCDLLHNLSPDIDPRLIILKGGAACGKTCLMRHIAYDWSQGKLEQFDLVLYAEFHQLTSSEQYSSIYKMALDGLSKFIANANHMQKIRSTADELMIYDGRRILVLLDGYDSDQVVHCNQLELFLQASTNCPRLFFYVILASRPEYISECRFKKEITIINVSGFPSWEQKANYIQAHFSGDSKANETTSIVADQLLFNETLMELAATPLFLFFICLLNNECRVGNFVELFRQIVNCMVDRLPKNAREASKIKISEISSKSAPLFLSDDSFFAKLGQLAFENFCCESEARYVLLQKDMEECGVQNSASKMGFLMAVDTFSFDQKLLQRSYKFQHKSFQAFFGALYFWKSKIVIDCLEQIIGVKKSEPELNQFISKIARDNTRVLENVFPAFKEKVSLCIKIYNQIVDFQCADRNPTLKVQLFKVLEWYRMAFQCDLPEAIRTAPFSDISYLPPLGKQWLGMQTTMLNIDTSPLMREIVNQPGMRAQLARSPNFFSYEREAALLMSEVTHLQSMVDSIGIESNQQHTGNGTASGTSSNGFDTLSQLD